MVNLESGFCILEALMELMKMGIFSGAPIKKRLYWPNPVQGNQIHKHFEGKEVAYVNSLKGKFVIF